MASFVVTGASRGLGLGLVKSLLSLPVDKVSRVFASSRSGSPNQDLSTVLENSEGRAKYVQINVDDSSSIQRAASHISSIQSDNGLDYLINVAGIRDPDLVPKLEDMSIASLRESLSTNVVGTHEMVVAFLPLLRQGSAKKIVMFSSTLAAATTAQTEGMASVPFPAYKISKAGTHMITALWSNQLKDEGFCVYMQSPGNLKTSLGGGQWADLEVDVGAAEVVRIALEAKPEDTGRHRNILVKGWEQGGGRGGKYDGLDLPW